MAELFTVACGGYHYELIKCKSTDTDENEVIREV